MAINKEIQSMDLLISAAVGVRANGSPLKKDFAFKNINPKASNDVLFRYGTALGDFIKHPKAGLYLREKHLLSETKA